jgi:hypothetical protein
MLRRVPHVDPVHGMYLATGSLDGEAPGRRKIRRLRVRGLDGAHSEGLAPLSGFRDLEFLEIERSRRLDFSPLAGLRLTLLKVEDSEDIDLSSLERLVNLQQLVLMDAFSAVVPNPLSLTANLLALDIKVDGTGRDGSTVRELVEAIEWSRLGALRILSLSVGTLRPLPLIFVDLGFLRELPGLRELQIGPGIVHQGGASPLEPPFSGLSQLQSVWIDAWQPEGLEDALRRHLGNEVTVEVARRFAEDSPRSPWAILALDDGSQWVMYGSLCDAEFAVDAETETEAVALAEARLRSADPPLLARLDFDEESDGTGIAAADPGDLETARTILGLDP